MPSSVYNLIETASKQFRFMSIKPENIQLNKTKIIKSVKTSVYCA